eukprot:TRINITY_DN17228_c0_g1_i1.p1 TRINITY_DN17228_c0_g1~~TRINITY_DN17228_c0_g1_i1.p1  ORF type:complete len:65 (-),score=1.68 TRINITY_DN17228_c0_g1_i1:329-523(-)
MRKKRFWCVTQFAWWDIAFSSNFVVFTSNICNATSSPHFLRHICVSTMQFAIFYSLVYHHFQYK